MMFVMDKKYEDALLFDFYGELLTEKQKAVFEEVVLCDLSLSEVADEHGISRQGVHDMVKRCGRILSGYETRLGLVRKFLMIKQKTEEIRRLTDNPEIRRIADDILEEL